MSRTRDVLLGCAIFAAAYGLGRMTTNESAPATHERVVVERGTIVQAAPVAHRGIDLDAVRAVVREEVAREVAPEPIDEETLARARSALDAGMADGRWTDEDRARLRPELLQLTPEAADEIFDKLFLALNAGTLRAEVNGPAV